MTPFGEAVRRLRARKGVSQKEMAMALQVSPAYLSALEHGKRGLPSFEFLQRVAGYFNIIWDEADELFAVARCSDPRVVIDTSGLPPEYTALANKLAAKIRDLDTTRIAEIDMLLEKQSQDTIKAL
ncbi:helix-turn-helix domain-containing protein [Oryzifoliimicrobium ureilyticus]|uniref:helix-turn-helix domain-containing protein n=1 Tax=Oryzifoliimicrobium ureilyticus TaxID=3113724 RepID=UPI0030764756